MDTSSYSTDISLCAYVLHPTLQNLIFPAQLYPTLLVLHPTTLIPCPILLILHTTLLILHPTRLILHPSLFILYPYILLIVQEFVHLISALLSITCMLLLGFADDVLDLRLATTESYSRCRLALL